MAKKPTTPDKAAKQQPVRKPAASAAAQKAGDRLTLLIERNYTELPSIAEREIVTLRLAASDAAHA